MHIQIMSDLHREFYNEIEYRPEIDKDADFIVIAGDISTVPMTSATYLNDIAEQTKGTIIAIPGNHEYYGNIYPSAVQSYKTAIKLQKHNKRIKFLNKQFFAPEGTDIAFLCATLWTDFDKGREIVPCLLGMNDFEVIYTEELGGRLMPHDVIKEHKHTLEFFSDAIEGPLAGKRIIVVTHHAPSYKSIIERFKRSRINAAYASSLERFIEKYEPMTWIHGHCHNFLDYQLGPTRVICNPVGYPQEDDYKELFTIEIE